MKIKSSAFKDRDVIPKKYTCQGEGFSPPLEFSDIPAETESLVLILEKMAEEKVIEIDWLVWNINPDEEMFLENSLPDNVIQGENSLALTGYSPPCFDDSNVYRFRLVALSNLILLREGADRYQLEQEIRGFIIDEAELFGIVGEPKND